jgi:hypothetical protein
LAGKLGAAEEWFVTLAGKLAAAEEWFATLPEKLGAAEEWFATLPKKLGAAVNGRSQGWRCCFCASEYAAIFLLYLVARTHPRGVNVMRAAAKEWVAHAAAAMLYAVCCARGLYSVGRVVVLLRRWAVHAACMQPATPLSPPNAHHRCAGRWFARAKVHGRSLARCMGC